jgi:hypothetical protein
MRPIDRVGPSFMAASLAPLIDVAAGEKGDYIQTVRLNVEPISPALSPVRIL